VSSPAAERDWAKLAKEKSRSSERQILIAAA
jgi:hypothetical protein